MPCSSLLDQLANTNVVNICERNPMRNVGDHWSSVWRTIEWVHQYAACVAIDEVAGLESLNPSPLQGKLIIVGGSGLIGPSRFEAAIESVLRQRPAAFVIWGAGHNTQLGTVGDPVSGWRRRTLRDERTLLWPEWFHRAHLIGVRDWAAGMPWAPCTSAMLTVFDTHRQYTPEADFVVLNHYEQPINVQDALRAGLRFEHITNNTEDLPAVIAALARARVVVTNSYHGAYWGLLLGRAVVVVAPNSTRFRHLRWPVVTADHHDWLDAIAAADPAPQALSQARQATAHMSRQVIELGQNLGLLPPRMPAPGLGCNQWSTTSPAISAAVG